MKIEKYFYGVCALCLLLSCQQVAKQVDTPVLPTKPFAPVTKTFIYSI